MYNIVDICLSRYDFGYWWVQGLICGKALPKIKESELTEIKETIKEDIYVSRLYNIGLFH